MTKKVVIVGGDSKLAEAFARIMEHENFEAFALLPIETSEPTAVLYEETQTIGIHPDFYNSLSERELYGITMPDALALINDRKLGEYKLTNVPKDVVADVKDFYFDDLPDNTTKPKFLMQRDHHIRSPRRGR